MIRAALAIGISQAGRYLRDHVEPGMNQDESRRKVFDGVLAHISGVGKVFANAGFGQPNRTNTQHEDHHFPENAFPFAHEELLRVFSVAPVDGAVVRSALRLSWPDFEEAVCAAAAAASRCEAIVSRDSAGFRDSPAPVIDPETARAWLAAR